jgi:hypothetical protein
MALAHCFNMYASPTAPGRMFTSAQRGSGARFYGGFQTLRVRHAGPAAAPASPPSSLFSQP